MFRRLENNSIFNANVKADISPVILKNQLVFGSKAIVKEGEGISCYGAHLAILVARLLSLPFLHTPIKNQHIYVIKPPLISVTLFLCLEFSR